MRYDAFLSYSHAADDALAPALQSALHRLARPWNRLRAVRVFRDKTSLSASPELWPAIVTALGDARYFLLLASPASAASKWVQKEVEWWLQHRSPQTMLILVTDGQLAWDETAADFDWARTDAIAPQLRGRFPSEPLWVDLRWARNGETLTLRHVQFRQAVLDVAAPLHGRSKDELDGEDVRQFTRTRRLARAAVAGLVALTITAIGAAWFAVRQRDEALRQATIAQAGRLAAQADLLRERGGATDASTMLAAEGVRLLDTIGERSLETDLALRRSLVLQPRRSGRFALYSAKDLSVANDGRHFAVNPDGTNPSMHDASGGSPGGCSFDTIRARLTAEGHPAASTHVRALTPDGSRCVSVSFDSGTAPEIRLWSASPLTQLALLPRSGGRSPIVALSEDAEFLAITDPAEGGRGDTPGRFRIWSFSRRADVVTQPAATFVAFGPGRRVFAATDGIWRLPSAGEAAATRVITWPRRPWEIHFSANGRVAATQDETRLTVWDLASGQSLRDNATRPGTLVAAHDDGRVLLLTGSSGAGGELWDAEDEEIVGTLALRPLAAFFDADDVVFVTAPTESEATIFAQRLSAGASSHTSFVAGETVRWLGIDAGRVTALVDAGTSARLDTWTLRAAAPVTQVRAEGPAPFPIAISADQRRFAFGRATGALVGAFAGGGAPRAVSLSGRPTALALDARGEILAATVGTRLEVRRVADGDSWQATVPADVDHIGLSSDGRWALVVHTQAKPAVRAGAFHGLVAWRTFASSAAVSVDLDAGGDPDLECQAGGDVDLVRAGPYLVDLAKAVVRSKDERGDPAPCGAIDPSTRRATIEKAQVTIADPGGVALARLDHPARVVRAALTADGRQAATLDARGVLRVWALTPRDLVAQACAESPQPLDDATWAQYLPATLTVDACGRARGDATTSR